MRQIISKIAIVLLMAFAIACEDESKDPVKFNSVAKATILALRGDAFNALNATGCSNSFFKNSIIGNEVYSVDADFLSEDQESLQEVQVYASIPTTTKGGLAARARKLVATVPGSAFTLPSGGTVKRGKISVTLEKIRTELNISIDSLAKLGYVLDAKDEPLTTSDILVDMDLVLTDGSKVLASSIVNPNLFQSVVFYPAMVLNYCANDVNDFLPAATTSLLGVWGTKDKAAPATGKTVSRTPIPSLKSGAKDTLYIKFDNDIIDPPIVTFSPASAGTVLVDVTPAKKRNADGFNTSDIDKSAFYLVYQAGGTYTGAVTATVKNATANIAGVVLTQADKRQTINVDNTAPVVISRSTGTRIGAGQFVTITVTFNEAVSAKSADAIKVTVDGTAQGLEKVTDANMSIASNGLSATLIYFFKLAVPGVAATHGDMVVDFTTTAKDLAGNAVDISDGILTVDVNAPPAPTLTAATGYDLGTQIRWSANTTSDPTPVTGNPKGAVAGNVYFIAITSGDLAPTKFAVDLDGVATWTMPVDDTPPAGADPDAKVVIRQTGTIAIVANGSIGQSGTVSGGSTVFTPFTANGTLDVYAVFVSSTGTISKIPAKPVTTTPAPATANPLTITMN